MIGVPGSTTSPSCRPPRCEITEVGSTCASRTTTPWPRPRRILGRHLDALARQFLGVALPVPHLGCGDEDAVSVAAPRARTPPGADAGRPGGPSVHTSILSWPFRLVSELVSGCDIAAGGAAGAPFERHGGESRDRGFGTVRTDRSMVLTPTCVGRAGGPASAPGVAVRGVALFGGGCGRGDTTASGKGGLED